MNQGPALTRAQVAWVALPPVLLVVAFLLLALLGEGGSMPWLARYETWAKLLFYGAGIVWGVGVLRIRRRTQPSEA